MVERDAGDFGLGGVHPDVYFFCCIGLVDQRELLRDLRGDCSFALLLVLVAEYLRDVVVGVPHSTVVETVD